MARDRIEREISIDAPPDRVWQVLTEAGHISQWFGDKTEIDLRPGGRASFGWPGEKYSFQAEVQRVEPPGFFSYRWAGQASAVGVTPAEGNSTLVEFTLTPEGTGTRLRVVETGFASLAGTEAERDASAGENEKGWTDELAELRTYAERIAR